MILMLHQSVRGAPLELHQDLTYQAVLRAHQLGDQNYLSHAGFEHPECCVYAGENIGKNSYPLDLVPSTFVDSLLSSSSHRDNVLDPNYQYIGIGVAFKNNFWWLVVEYGGN